MADDSNKLERFLNESMTLGRRMQEDSAAAKKIFEALKKKTDFETIIAQRRARSDDFLAECKAFARAIETWNRDYPHLLDDFRTVLNIVITDLEHVAGIRISRSGSDVSINFNQRDFVYRFEQNYSGRVGTFSVSESDKELIAKREYRIVQEISEIISLEMHLLVFLNHIASLSNRYDIMNVCAAVQRASDVDGPDFLKNMHALTAWWLEVYSILYDIKKLTHTAVKMDDKVAKELTKLFWKEQKQRLRDRNLRMAKIGLNILSKFTLELLPGGGIIKWLIDGAETAKLLKEARELLKETGADEIAG
jgi:hypothetical protein